MDIKDILKNRRIDLGLTLKEVAEAVDVSEATVSRWESGDIANMKRDRIDALSRVLDISPLVILGRPEDQQAQTARRLAAYETMFTRLDHLSDTERQKALRLIDGVIRTFEE